MLCACVCLCVLLLLLLLQMTSCFIHLFPSWFALTLRWYPLDPIIGGEVSAEPECPDGMDRGDIGTAFALYLLWQVLYYIKTEVADKVRAWTRPVGQITAFPTKRAAVCLLVSLFVRLFRGSDRLASFCCGGPCVTVEASPLRLGSTGLAAPPPLLF